MGNNRLWDVIDSCWAHFVSFRDADNSLIANPSIPILWFGDYRKYMDSPNKIVTVAINPSSDEFKLKKDTSFNFVRFKYGEKIFKNDKLNEEEKLIYFNTLNQYFYDTPYEWFKRLETPLNCLDATYGGKYINNDCMNIAIHLDLCPLATSIKWGNLSANERKPLEKEGAVVLNQLLKALSPDIIVVSISESYIKRIFNVEPKDEIIDSYTNDAGGYIKTYKYNGSWLIAGRNMKGTPYGGMSYDFIKESLGDWRRRNE